MRPVSVRLYLPSLDISEFWMITVYVLSKVGTDAHLALVDALAEPAERVRLVDGEKEEPPRWRSE